VFLSSPNEIARLSYLHPNKLALRGLAKLSRPYGTHKIVVLEGEAGARNLRVSSFGLIDAFW
jgi:hypothetical protein